MTRALLTVLSLGNIHHSKYLDSGGGSWPHQLPTRLVGDIWAGGTSPSPRAHSTSGLSGTRPGLPRWIFCAGNRTFQPPPGTWWQHPAHRRQPRCCSSSPQQPTPARTRSLQLSATGLQVCLCTSKVTICRQDHIFVPKIMFISPSFVHTNKPQ